MPADKQHLSDEARYRLLKLLDENPGMSQRDLAEVLGISLGKTNYCIRALIDKGWVKAANFHNSRRKIGYLYKLTPKGISEKALSTRRFLSRKLKEYEKLEDEIRILREEIGAMNDDALRGKSG